MPHFKDGTPAAIGDKVKGKPYNTPHEVVGIITSITPDMDSCNCKVAFVEIADIDTVTYGVCMVTVDSSAVKRFLIIKEDYGAIKDFEKIV